MILRWFVGGWLILFMGTLLPCRDLEMGLGVGVAEGCNT